MKKLILSALVMLFIATGAAQAQVSLGVKAGLNYSNFNDSQFDGRTSVNYGLMVNVPVTKSWSIQTGAMINNKGGRDWVNKFWQRIKLSDGSYYDYFDKQKYYFSSMYIDIPVNLAYEYKINPYHSIYAAAGPYASVLLNAQFKSTFTGETRKYSMIDDNTFGYKRFNYGLNFEFGYLYEGFQFSLAYDLGLGNVASNKVTLTHDVSYGGLQESIIIRPDLKNRVLKFNIAYFFKLSNKPRK